VIAALEGNAARLLGDDRVDVGGPVRVLQPRRLEGPAASFRGGEWVGRSWLVVRTLLSRPRLRSTRRTSPP
jgi:hypothetical protein